MLNRANRYLPIIELVRRFSTAGSQILDVGSGYMGIGEFYPDAFFGCDLSFDRRPIRNMMPLIASAKRLPFSDRAFDIVIASDVFEHIAPGDRNLVLGEILRVSRRLAVLGFPSGEKALAADIALLEAYEASGRPVPSWLSEHMFHSFPDERICEGFERNFKVTIFANEAISFHMAVMKFEMWRVGRMISIVLARFMPTFCAWLVRKFTYQPCYRKIICLERIG